MTAKLVRRKKESEDEKKDRKLLLPTGSVLLNLACADDPRGGYGPGRLVNIIGDSFSGKTILALTCLAEIARRPEFDHYDLIYDDSEMASDSFDYERLFGKKFIERVGPPARDENGQAVYSLTVEDFHSNVNKMIKRGNPFVYVLDSFDAISDESEICKSEEILKARQSGRSVSGSYFVSKPKYASQMFRLITGGLSKTKSLLIIISQTRDRINDISFGNPKTRSGGNALRFYSSHEIWLSYKKSYKDPESKRTYGARTQVKITKNKITGKLRECEIDIFNDYGIDDIGSCIDFLVNEGCWKTTGNGYIVATLGKTEKKSRKKGIIEWIEREGLEGELVELSGRYWNALEEKIRLNRKARFS